MKPMTGLGEQKVFVSCAKIADKRTVRTLKVTAWASVAGWIAALIGGNVVGILLSRAHSGTSQALSTLTFAGLFTTEVGWAGLMAIAILPFSFFFLAPILFFQLEKPSRHPLLATFGGGLGGFMTFGFWALICGPDAWRPLDTRTLVLMFGTTALIVGAVATAVGAWRDFFRRTRRLRRRRFPRPFLTITSVPFPMLASHSATPRGELAGPAHQPPTFRSGFRCPFSAPPCT